jgi:hypothetical protein
VGVELKRVLKKCICGQIREIPGLKPIEYAGYFAGLKPCASTQKAKGSDFFSSL